MSLGPYGPWHLQPLYLLKGVFPPKKCMAYPSCQYMQVPPFQVILANLFSGRSVRFKPRPRKSNPPRMDHSGLGLHKLRPFHIPISGAAEQLSSPSSSAAHNSRGGRNLHIVTSLALMSDVKVVPTGFMDSRMRNLHFRLCFMKKREDPEGNTV